MDINKKEGKWDRITVLKDLMLKVSKYVEEGKYSSKANFVDNAIRDKIRQEEGDC